MLKSGAFLAAFRHDGIFYPNNFQRVGLCLFSATFLIRILLTFLNSFIFDEKSNKKVQPVH